jgi:hypothetical protein
MAELPRLPASDRETDDTAVDTDRSADVRTPRWVIVFAVIALVLVVLVVIQHLAGGGFGGMMNHGMPQP